MEGGSFLSMVIFFSKQKTAYEIMYGDWSSDVCSSDLVDLFNHGAHEGVWWGEDYAFCRNWCDAGGEIRLVPDLDITHHDGERAYPGNFHQFLLRQPQPEQAPAAR